MLVISALPLRLKFSGSMDFLLRMNPFSTLEFFFYERQERSVMDLTLRTSEIKNVTFGRLNSCSFFMWMILAIFKNIFVSIV